MTSEPEQKYSSEISSNQSKETMPTIKLEDPMEQERREAYIKPETRDLLRKLLQDGDKQEIIPIYFLSLGFIYQTNGKSDENATIQISIECLENLARLDILQKDFYDSVLSCPNCESTIITLHSRCPKCKGHNIDKTSLIEHILCGHIDQKNKYINTRCPNCGELLVKGQFRYMGLWYVCNECGERFENSEPDLVCRNCNKKFTIKEARVKEIPKFSLNLARKEEIRQNVASLESILTLLDNLGFSVEMPGLAVGKKSGMRHQFSLIARKSMNDREVIVALDHAVAEPEVSSSPLILYIYKISEVRVDIPIFVAIPKLDETGRKIAQGNNILLIEGSTDKTEVLYRIYNEIEARTKQRELKNEYTAEHPGNKTEKTSFLRKISGLKRR